MSEKSNYKKIKTDIPMWEIDGNEKLTNYAAIIAEINFQLKSLEKELIETNENIDAIDKRINLYLGNVLNIRNFVQSEYAILITEDYHINVYTLDSIDKDIDDEDYELEVTDLPSEPFLVHKSNSKQALKIVNYLEEYNDLISEYNDEMEYYESYADDHKTLWTEVKDVVKQLNFLSVKDSEIEIEEDEEEIEYFDDKKHILIIAQNSSNEWGFRYINKKDEKKLNKLLLKQHEE